MILSVREKLEQGPMFDMAIVEHHFTSYLRDYDILVDVVAASPEPLTCSYIEGRYRYRFSHCVFVNIVTSIQDHVWQKSWSDDFIDYKQWEALGCPDGYVWGVCYSDAYPGLSYLESSELAKQWSERLQKSMHEIIIETNAHNFQLVFHDVSIHKIAKGFPGQKTLIDIDPVNIFEQT